MNGAYSSWCIRGASSSTRHLHHAGLSEHNSLISVYRMEIVKVRAKQDQLHELHRRDMVDRVKGSHGLVLRHELHTCGKEVVQVRKDQLPELRKNDTVKVQNVPGRRQKLHSSEEALNQSGPLYNLHVMKS